MAIEVIAKSGPGAVAPVAPKTVAPVTPAAPSAPPASKSPEVAALETKLADERRIRDVMLQKQKGVLSAEAKKERDGFGAKLTRLGELEKMHAQAKLNPEAFLKGVYGEGWYDAVVSAKLNNGVPTADVLASEIAKVEEKFEAKFKAREEELAKQTAAQSAAQREAELNQARRQLTAEAAQVWKAKADEYPLVAGLGTPEAIAAELARRAEAHYNRTTKKDETGSILVDGEVPSLQKLAESWEGELVALAERAAAHAKYAGKFALKSAAPVSPNVVQQPRRTLSNDLTGRTPARSAPANDSEKRERAIAAFEARSKSAS